MFKATNFLYHFIIYPSLTLNHTEISTQKGI